MILHADAGLTFIDRQGYPGAMKLSHHIWDPKDSGIFVCNRSQSNAQLQLGSLLFQTTLNSSPSPTCMLTHKDVSLRPWLRVERTSEGSASSSVPPQVGEFRNWLADWLDERYNYTEVQRRIVTGQSSGQTSKLASTPSLQSLQQGARRASFQYWPWVVPQQWSGYDNDDLYQQLYAAYVARKFPTRGDVLVQDEPFVCRPPGTGWLGRYNTPW